MDEKIVSNPKNQKNKKPSKKEKSGTKEQKNEVYPLSIEEQIDQFADIILEIILKDLQWKSKKWLRWKPC